MRHGCLLLMNVCVRALSCILLARAALPACVLQIWLALPACLPLRTIFYPSKDASVDSSGTKDGSPGGYDGIDSYVERLSQEGETPRPAATSRATRRTKRALVHIGAFVNVRIQGQPGTSLPCTNSC